MTNKDDVDVKFVHFRAPEWSAPWLKGAPDPSDLEYYSRQFGWGVEEMLIPFVDGVGPFPRGGATLCFLDGDDATSVGVAVCSWRDNFSYKRGRKIAYERALLALNGEETGPRDGSEEYMGDRYIEKLQAKRERYLETIGENDSDEEE